LYIRVSFRWRKSIEDDWQHGSIRFHHQAQPPRPVYGQPLPKRKPSAAKQAEELQRDLAQTWAHMMRSALYTVRDYFQEGGDGALIPKEFEAVVDPHTRHLNNFSLNFWRKKQDESI
jgi:hypothetical protein